MLQKCYGGRFLCRLRYKTDIISYCTLSYCIIIQQRSEAAHPATAPRSFVVLGGYTLAYTKKCECSFKMAQGHIMVSLDVHLTCPTAHMESPASMMKIHNEICSHLLQHDEDTQWEHGRAKREWCNRALHLFTSGSPFVTICHHDSHFQM